MRMNFPTKITKKIKCKIMFFNKIPYQPPPPPPAIRLFSEEEELVEGLNGGYVHGKVA